MKTLFCIILMGLGHHLACAQGVGINEDGSEPDASAILHVHSDSKGLLISRMEAAARLSIQEPATGLLVYQTDGEAGFFYHDGHQWIAVADAAATRQGIRDINGNSYPIVRIGAQWWMAENLRTLHFNNGDPIPLLASAAQWSDASYPASSAYNGSPGDYGETYGLLYNAYAVTDIRNLCPSDWRVATTSDWQLLNETLGADAGGKLKSPGFWEYPNTGASNASGFAALPAGLRHENGYFGALFFQTLFWAPDSDDGEAPQSSVLTHESSEILLQEASPGQGLSVRCVLPAQGEEHKASGKMSTINQR